MSFKDLFPDIFVLAQHQEKSVAEMWSPQGWNMIFRRNLNDWEIPRMIELFKLLRVSKESNQVKTIYGAMGTTKEDTG